MPEELDKKNRPESEEEERISLVFQVPCRIVDGKCSRCKENLSLWTEQIQRGKDQPKYCPYCKGVFRTDTITVPIWICVKCGTEVLDLKRQKFCTGCGRSLVLPPKNHQNQKASL